MRGVLNKDGKSIWNYDKGIYKSYFRNGKIKRVVNQGDNKFTVATFYSNGKFKSKLTFITNEYSDFWNFIALNKESYELQNKFIINLEKKFNNGSFIEFYKNGNLKQVKNVLNNQLDGIYQRYSIKGELLDLGFYESGKNILNK